MAGTIPSDVFFELVDEVLVNAGRRQLEAVNRRIIEVKESDRVLQILAGPGSGKTEMLVWRVLYELFVRGIPARRVMVTTFTRKAATELNVRVVERADALLERAHVRGISLRDPRVHDLRVGTIHALCDSLLAEFDPGYMEAGTQLIDEVETTVRLARELRTLGYTGDRKSRAVDRLLACEEFVALYRAPWADENWPATSMERLQWVQSVLGHQTETWLPRCGPAGTPNGIQVLHKVPTLTEDLEKIRTRWETYLSSQQVLDFTTLQKVFVDKQVAILEHVDHVLVDEFQDTNPIQFAIHTNWLSRTATRLTVVGDDDQAMYRFRGSDFECFTSLEPHCASRGVAFRREKLEKNWRSTAAIVSFSQVYRAASVLQQVSMQKAVVAGDDAQLGVPVRLLEGPWAALANVVALEVGARLAAAGPDPDTAILMFSTSERGTEATAARAMRETLEAAELRVYNPRNKTAAAKQSPIAELLGLLSYLIDPVVKAPVGKGGRMVEVCATKHRADASAQRYLSVVPPSFPISDAHVGFQKWFVKGDGGAIGDAAPGRREVLEFLDAIRAQLVAASKKKKEARLTFAGLVARLLSFPRFRDCGYTVELFRQAAFTGLLEANVAPSRRSRRSLDSPLRVDSLEKTKIVWPSEYWSFMHVFGSLLNAAPLDDDEVEAFAEHAVALLTFHQSKGLEFDHVYVGGTGHKPSPNSVLLTMLFSGKKPKYKVIGGVPVSKDAEVVRLATADKEREVYVALTRAKKTLTILHDPSHKHPLMGLDPVVAKLAESVRGRKYSAAFPNVVVKGLAHA